MTLTRPPVVRPEALTVARKPRNQSAPPSSGPRAIGGRGGSALAGMRASLGCVRGDAQFANGGLETPSGPGATTVTDIAERAGVGRDVLLGRPRGGPAASALADPA